MDLTPPPLTRSPASPPHSHCPSDRSSLGYPSPELVAQQYKISTIYGPPCSTMAQPMDAETSLPPLDTMTMGHQSEWPQSAVLQTSSASSAVPSIISSEYESYGNYEAAQMGSAPGPTYNSHDVYGSHQSSASSAMSHSPPPPQQTHSRSPISAVSRTGSLSYAVGPSLGQPLTPRVKMEGPVASQPHQHQQLQQHQQLPHPQHQPQLQQQHQHPHPHQQAQPAEYGPGSGVEVTHYPSPRSMHAPYQADSGAYPQPGSGYISDTQSSAWSKDYQSAEPDHFYPSLAGPQAVGFMHNRRPLRLGRPRARKRLTTKEEANFQCEVKGCGKLFSRSYNFKAHMETHDEKREYPFPCTFSDCDRRFVRKTDMVRHRQSVHDKQRNHKCDYCGRPFARKDTLRRHMEDGCSKRFDLTTLDIRADGGYDTMGHGVRSVGATMSHHMVPPHGALPPMAIPPINTGGMLAPVSVAAPLRASREVMHGGDQNPGQQHWGR